LEVSILLELRVGVEHQYNRIPKALKVDDQQSEVVEKYLSWFG
jgi:hypothetical protein